MKTRKSALFVVLVSILSFYQIGFAQTYNEEETVEEQVVEGNNLNATYLASLGIGTGTDSRNQSVQGNSVFLTQIGEFNQLSVRTSTNASEINVTQEGDFNTASMTYVANTVVANLIQNGNSNTFTDFINNRSQDVTLDLVQDGDNLSFQREGANNLTKSIKFRQSEGTPNLIIRSIN
ncbi:hypothetical protein [Cochleicola gelatinilyticus]|uniref:Curlin associated repeat-containing protein n=1 Tax=Cochleicola gelatinilyticus TaxID=1763537 RepID=A0A167ERT7_9FLAO|nr:hypothetical protein [Cochleicola gelatinilyticus]OAB75822.1 hypothetical protein ULVI_15210 [Cochleicola gelatinilyticus]